MTTLILGATGGIGSALARTLAGRGERLLLSGRDETKLRPLAGELGAWAQPADLGYESHVRTLLGAAQAHLGGGPAPLTTLIYAAGAALPQPLAESEAAQVRAVWNANYFGALWTLKYGLPLLSSGGRVYLLGARPEYAAARGFSQYAASKAALAALAGVTRLERRGLSVTLVLPPAVATPLWDQVGRVPPGALAPGVVAAAIAEHMDGAPSSELVIQG